MYLLSYVVTTVKICF